MLCSVFQLRVTHHLMYAMGNTDYADSQRQASITLEVASWECSPCVYTLWAFFYLFTNGRPL